jgi:DNA-binding GntR family transcriptional regulator
MTLNRYLKQAGGDTPRVERTSLKTQSTDLLRAQILSGKLPQGTRIAEKDLAELLGVSRMPARDALVDLEHEGLIVSKPSGRFVIQLDKEDIQNLFQVRIVLERLAVSQAAQQRTAKDNELLQANLERMRQAIAHDNRDAYVKSDLEAHQLIWQQARNQYLLKMLNSIIGPIFVFMGSHTEFQNNWQETLQMHQELTEAICAGDVDRAVESIDGQLQYSLRLSLQAFEQAKPISHPTA